MNLNNLNTKIIDTQLYEVSDIENIIDDLLKTTIAFSNTNGGRIFIGLSQDSDNQLNVVGIKKNEVLKLIDEINRSISVNVMPEVSPRFFTKKIDNKLILVIDIPRGNLTPYYLNSEELKYPSYTRFNSRTTRSSNTEVQELIALGLSTTPDTLDIYDDEDSLVTPEEIENLCEDLNKFKKTRNNLFTVDYLLDHEIVLIGEDQEYYSTLAYNLLSEKDRKYKIVVEHNDVRKEFKKPLHVSAVEILDYIKKEYDLLKSYDNKLVDSLNQLILNAIIHRDQLTHDETTIQLLEDGFKVLSPGGIFTNKCLGFILNNSILRNRQLYSVFEDLDINNSTLSLSDVVKNLEELNFDVKFNIHQEFFGVIVTKK